jgi:hypothetical protein
VTVQYFQGGDIRVGLVGDEALEAMPVQIGERELRAGMRTLASADKPGSPRKRVREVDLTVNSLTRAPSRSSPSAPIAERHSHSPTRTRA